MAALALKAEKKILRNAMKAKLRDISSAQIQSQCLWIFSSKNTSYIR
jgi:hypothetical protein